MTDQEQPGDKMAFEEALDRLEGLVDEMESGELPLEETIQRFEEGQKLLRICGRLLEQAELRVSTILGKADLDSLDADADADEDRTEADLG